MVEVPLISIITVVYNSVDTIEDTILSVINQNYSRIEYIIIDGGSTDGTLPIIKKYANRISYFESEKDGGIYYAMNKGIDRANGEWMNFMNSGDEFQNNQVLSDIFSEDLQGVDIVYGNTEIVGENIEPFIEISGNKSNFWKSLIRHQSIFSRTELNKKFKFKTNYKVSADFDFMFQIFLLGYVTKHVNVIVTRFNIIGFSDTNRYIGFAEDRKIALSYKGNSALRYKVYTHYLMIPVFSKAVLFLKNNTPAIYRTLKGLTSK